VEADSWRDRYPGPGTAGTSGSTTHLQGYRIFEFRRYRTKHGQRARFAEYFDTFLPEAYEQEWVIILGSFLDCDDPDGFVWIRGFRDTFQRGYSCSEFFFGPVWREHRARMVDLVDDGKNILLLTSDEGGRDVTVPPAVDPVLERDTDRGRVFAQVFSVAEGRIGDFLHAAHDTFASYRSMGIREVALLSSFGGANTFPQHAVRTDGPHVVWLGMTNDPSFDSKIRAAVSAEGERWASSNLVRGPPELLVLEPTRRSRLRWMGPPGVDAARAGSSSATT
jgi:hypothetical protein